METAIKELLKLERSLQQKTYSQQQTGTTTSFTSQAKTPNQYCNFHKSTRHSDSECKAQAKLKKNQSSNALV